MLNQLRKNAGGWAARILIALLVVAFAVWGIADIFRGFSTDTVLTAGETEITVERFNAEYRRRLNELGDRLGQPISPSEGRQYGIDRRVLAQLAGGAVLSEEAKNLGISVSDAMVAADLRSDESFFGAFGKFDRQTFELILQQNQISETSFVNDRREFLARDQLLSSVTAGVVAPEGLAEAIHNYRYERRTARYVVMPPDLVGVLEDPSDEVVADYHQQAARRFTRPETRSFTVLTIRPDDIAPTIAIDETFLEEEFENRRDEFDKPETRTVIQLPVADAETAADVSTRLRGGEKMETVLTEIGLSIDDVTLNDVTVRGFLSTDISNAAFALEDGQVSEPIEGPLGYVVLIVTGINPAVPAMFEDVREALKAELLGAQAADAVFDVYNDVEDARAGGASLQEVADRLSFDLVSVEEVTRDGLTLAGPPPANMPNIPGLVAQVFTNDVGIEIPAGDLEGDGYFWVEVTAVTPAELKPLDDVRDDVIALWKAEKRKAALEEMAQSLVERGNKGETFDSIAGSLGRAPLTSPVMLRRFSNETFSRVGVTKVFATPSGKFTYALAGFGDSMVLMEVASVDTPEPGTGSADLEEIKSTLAEAASDDLIASLVIALQAKYDVQVNYGLVDQILSPGTGG